MAITKNQARAGREESAQRSTAVNERGGIRVGTSTSGEVDGDEARSASGSERARRVANRGRVVEQDTATTSNREEDIRQTTLVRNRRGGGQTAEDEAQVVKERTASGSGSSMLAEGVESKNYFTAFAEDETGEVNEEATAVGA